jgi:hypothetical protein
MTITTSTIVLSSVFIIVIVGRVLFRHRPLKDLRGPPSTSFVLGAFTSRISAISLIGLFFVAGHEHRMRHQDEVIPSL